MEPVNGRSRSNSVSAWQSELLSARHHRKGWVKANNFRRSDNKWAYTYLLTPSGASAKLRLARAFLERKEREFEHLQQEIAVLRTEVSSSNHSE